MSGLLSRFDPVQRSETIADITFYIPDQHGQAERWQTLLQASCTFPPDMFHSVMLNLIKNPNVTSSHLFRADILYDAEEEDQPEGLDLPLSPKNGLHDQIRPDYRPRQCRIRNMKLQRTMVRQLIPRNPQRDRPLIQTCLFFGQDDKQEQTHLVVYVPHVDDLADMPFYHPSVRKLAFLHRWSSSSTSAVQAHGTISISYVAFDQTTDALPANKFDRTALRLLQTIHKHGQGQLAGYEKRVHLDRLIPQKRYQDTYTRLKTAYGRQISENWVEVTDPGKHVFEDLGIAAYLIELWRDMYRLPETSAHPTSEQDSRLPDFPGFVDIGCGNGLLVSILLSEGYPGWGFDARERKTWSTFPPNIRIHLQQKLLVPDILQQTLVLAESSTTKESSVEKNWHDGRFTPGTFIISNHADELTPWTPFIAALNNSAFIAIPCCSHDLSGSRFRAPSVTKGMKVRQQSVESDHEYEDDNGEFHDDSLQERQQSKVTASAERAQRASHETASMSVLHDAQAAETGSLKRSAAQKKMPSAYASLCSYVSSLTEEAGFIPETDVLRIPSTRNQCIVGRTRLRPKIASHENGAHDREIAMHIGEIVERELGQKLEDIGKTWIERARKIAQKPGSGH